MGFNKADFEGIDDRLKQIVTQPVETIEVTDEVPPTLDELSDSNKAYSLNAAILFIDIRKSTHLTESSQARTMVKIYRSFMRMTVSCVRKCGGVTRQFLGDRIMGVFLDSFDDEGKVTIPAVDKAVECASAMQTTLDYSLNRLLKYNMNNKIISCGIGIDCGKVLLTKVGMYGVEADESKENETDCVWVGNSTNRASKYSDLAKGGEIFISEEVFRKLSSEFKPDGIWENVAKHKSRNLFRGYICQDFYIDFAEEMTPVKGDLDEHGNEDFTSIVDTLKQIDQMQQRLSKKEVELKVLEEKLKRRKIRNEEVQSGIEKQQLRLDLSETLLESNKKDIYKTLIHFVKYSHCKDEYIAKMGLEFWEKIISSIYEIGKGLGKKESQITRELDCELIGIYDYFKIHDKAYDTMILMAEKNLKWVSIKKNTLLWAKQQNIVWKLREAIEKTIKESPSGLNVEDYQERLSKIKKIVGFR